MASTLVTIPKPFIAHNNASASSVPTHTRLLHLGLRRNSLRIKAVAAQWEPVKVVPQGDRVLIRLDELPEKSAGGVLLPKSAVKFERYLAGEILSVGADVEEVEVGKKVLLSDVNADEVDFGADGRHCFCKASELLAMVD